MGTGRIEIRANNGVLSSLMLGHLDSENPAC